MEANTAAFSSEMESAMPALSAALVRATIRFTADDMSLVGASLTVVAVPRWANGW